ncbi:MAG: NAD(P)-binding domain-containing protein [Bacteroides sp.]|nr:NAD(P)-binding domain-containing protein [Bacteroides sp.]
MKIAVLGAGAMGGAVASGLLEYGNGLYQLYVSNPSSAPLESLSSKGADVTHDNCEAVKAADIVIVAVKPWIVREVLTEIKSVLDFNRQYVVVIAAGIKGSEIATWLDSNATSKAGLLIAMPNTAMTVAQSMTFIVPVNATPRMIDEVTALFNCLGETMVIDEAHLPAATALASCGIAYAMRYVRASVEGGIELGFKASAAQKMVVQTLRGAAALLSIEGAHPESEIDKVTTPGGITIRGLNEMENAGFTSAVIRGLRASK